MDFKSKHFERMESLVMKGNDPLVTYGRTLGEPSGKFDYYVLYPRTKKQISPSSAKKDHNQNQKPPLIPYYQKVLPQTLKCQPLPTKST